MVSPVQGPSRTFSVKNFDFNVQFGYTIEVVLLFQIKYASKPGGKENRKCALNTSLTHWDLYLQYFHFRHVLLTSIEMPTNSKTLPGLTMQNRRQLLV